MSDDVVVDSDAIDYESEALATRVSLARPPAQVLAEAHEAAVALGEVLAGKKNPVRMNGEQYLEWEDWQTVGRFYGVTAREDGDAEYVELGQVAGFKANSVAVNARGMILSRATAYCLNDEEKWRARPKYEWHMVLVDGSTALEEVAPREKWVWEPHPTKPDKNRPKRAKVLVGEEPVPLFQLASMAQTRANAKALSNVLRWVVVLAGYRGTPAEEMSGAEREERTPDVRDSPRQATPPAREPGSDDGDETWVETHDGTRVQVGSGAHAAAAGAERNESYDPRAQRPGRSAPAPAGPKVACPHCGKPAGPSKFPKDGRTHYCYPCKHAFDPNEDV